MTEHPGEPPDGEPIKLDQIGISHVSFTVPSVAQLTQQLLAKGYQTAGPPDAFQDQAGRIRTVFFFDPDGILVQFDEGSGGGGGGGKSYRGCGQGTRGSEKGPPSRCTTNGTARVPGAARAGGRRVGDTTHPHREGRGG